MEHTQTCSRLQRIIRAGRNKVSTPSTSVIPDYLYMVRPRMPSSEYMERERHLYRIALRSERFCTRTSSTRGRPRSTLNSRCFNHRCRLAERLQRSRLQPLPRALTLLPVAESVVSATIRCSKGRLAGILGGRLESALTANLLINIWTVHFQSMRC
jgi:hypothetical protein